LTPTTPRRFTVLDGMILVAAVACGLSLRREAHAALQPHTVMPYENRVESTTRRTIEAMFPFLATMTPAVLIMSLRRPRPRWRKLVRRPGMAACCAAILPLIVSLIELHRLAMPLEGHTSDNLRSSTGELLCFCSWLAPVGQLYGDAGIRVGLWVAGAWLILALSGFRRRERSWINGLGRVVGIGWISILGMRALAYIINWTIMN
jgi:hypothetical protein